MKWSPTYASDLVLSKNAVHTVRETVARADDREVCGFLLGRQLNDSVYVASVRPAENIYRDKNSFAISQKELAAALGAASSGLDVVGIYHTHFGSAQISCYDRRIIALHPFLWLIVGVLDVADAQTPDWKCFKQVGGHVKEVQVRFED